MLMIIHKVRIEVCVQYLIDTMNVVVKIAS